MNWKEGEGEMFEMHNIYPWAWGIIDKKIWKVKNCQAWVALRYLSKGQKPQEEGA